MNYTEKDKEFGSHPNVIHEKFYVKPPENVCLQMSFNKVNNKN